MGGGARLGRVLVGRVCGGNERGRKLELRAVHDLDGALVDVDEHWVARKLRGRKVEEAVGVCVGVALAVEAEIHMAGRRAASSVNTTLVFFAIHLSFG